MNKIKQFLVRIFWIVYSLSMLAIFAIALSKPLNNLIPINMTGYTLVWVAFFGGLAYLMYHYENNILKYQNIIRKFIPLWLIILGVLLYIVSVCLRCGPISDYEIVYNTAYCYANGLEINTWEYFSRWNNNVGYMLVLAFLFKLVSFTNSPDAAYYFVLFVNVIQVVAVIGCIKYIIGRLMSKHAFICELMSIIIASMWIPFWANSSIFYSDQLSMGAAIFGIAILVKGHEKKKNFLYSVFYSVFAGIFFAVGIIIKATSATVLIAIVIGQLLFWGYRKYLKEVLTIILVICAVFVAYKQFTKNMPYQEHVETLKAPVEYWLALGINGNGTYADNEKFAIECLTAGDYKQRKEFSRNYINEHISNLWNFKHYAQKVRENFGVGDLGAAGYLIWPESENIIWNFVSQEGKYFWKYNCVTTSLFFAWIFISAMGGLKMSVKRIYEKEDFTLFVPALAFWGMALFLMFWEAQNKQLYNHSGIMIMMLVLFLNLLGNEVGKKCGKIK